MCGKNFTFWCYTFLLFVFSSLSKPQKNYTSNEEKDNNLIKRYLNVNSTINYGDKVKILRYDLYEKSANNTQDEYYTNSKDNNREDNNSVQYELETHSIKSHESDNYILMKLHANSTKVNNSKKNFTLQELYRDLMQINDSKNSTSYEFYETFNKGDNKYNIVSNEMCGNITCIQLCCPLDNRLIDDKCISAKNNTLTSFPSVYKHINESLQNESKRVDKLFHLIVRDPCQKSQHYLLDSNLRDHSEYIFFTNGSLYFPHNHKFLKSTSYCLAVMQQDKFDVIICSAVNNKKKAKTHNKKKLLKKKKKPSFKSLRYTSMKILSTLVLLITFLVYSTLPELRNTHGFMLCMYSGLMIAGKLLFLITDLINVTSSSICITIALTKYFCYLASYFWLTVMSFNIWWTFKKLLQRNLKEGKKKKLLIYSIYACGFPCILTIICGIINFIPGVPKNFRPIVVGNNCWIGGIPFYLYFYIFKSICIISSVCLSISAALKIRHYEKDATHHVRNLESQCHNDNKKWLNLYLKLFIVMFIIMGIKWCLAIGYLLYTKHEYNEYFHIIKYNILLVMDILINLSIFIIFVCKKKIMRLLLKRFGCQKCTLLSKTQYDANETSSNTCITMSEDLSMPEKMNSYKKTSSQKTHSDATELEYCNL